MKVEVGTEVDVEMRGDGMPGPRWNYAVRLVVDQAWFMEDYGGNGVWARACVLDIRARTSVPSEYKVLLHVFDGGGEWWLPLALFDDQDNFPGGPRPRIECECGADTAYGIGNKTHSHWCPKHEDA
jgi:hypothetical protein